jgi:hypothetical protein
MPTNKTPVISERNPPLRVFDIYEGDDPLILFADGTARLMMGPEISKIEFVRSNGPRTEGAIEVDQREIFARLALPTSAFVEMCAICLEQYGKNAEAIQVGGATNRNNVKEAIKRVAALKI